MNDEGRVVHGPNRLTRRPFEGLGEMIEDNLCHEESVEAHYLEVEAEWR